MVIDQFQPGDIVLADRFFCSYWVIAALLARGVDVVVRLHQCRTADFRRGRRLGREDHLVTWPKPQQVPDWMSRAEYDAMPAELTVRELRVRVQDKTKRGRKLVIVTTLLDAKMYRAKEVGDLFRQRWHAELDLRSLKTDMKMEMLRTKSPEMVRKEVATHLLGYNLIRGIMAEAARVGGGEATAAELHGGAAHDPRVRGGSSLRSGADRGGPAAAVGVDRQEAGGRSSGPLRATGGEATSEAAPAAEDAPEEGQSLIKRGIIPYNKEIVLPTNDAP